MNCPSCGGSVQAQKVKKQNENFGKTFFACGHCNKMTWQSQMVSESLRRPLNSLPSKSSPGKSKVIVKIYIDEIELNPFRVWIHTLHSFNTAINEYYKRIPSNSKKFSPTKKIWSFDINVYDDIVNNLTSSQFDFVDLIPLPKFLHNGLKKIAEQFSHMPKLADIQLNIRESLLSTLKSFQIDGIKFVVQHDGRALIGDEMGTGKTVQALACIEHFQQYLPALIIVQSNLLTQWKGEIDKFCKGFIAENELCVVRKASDIVAGKVCLVPYSILQRLTSQQKLKPEQFGIVVCDESHNLKNKDSQKTVVAVPFLRRATIAICLSGTPATNRPVELFSQLNALVPKLFTDYDQFTRRYCDAKESRFGRGQLDVRGNSNEEELKKILQGVVMIRRLKENILTELPEKQRELHTVELDPCYLSQLRKLEKEAARLNESLKNPRNDSATNNKIKSEQQANMTLQYTSCGLAKIAGVVKFIRELLEEARDSQRDRDLEEYGVEIEETSAADCCAHSEELWTSDARSSDTRRSRRTSASSSNAKDVIVIDADEDDVIFGDNSLLRSASKNQATATASGIELSGRKRLRSKKKTAKTADGSDDDVLFVDNSYLKPSSDSKNSSKKGSSALFADTDETSEDYRSDKDEAAVAWKTLLSGKTRGGKSSSKVSGKSGRTGKGSKKQTRCLDHKIIVFAHHAAVMDALEDCLRDMNVAHIRVDGKVSSSKRDVLIKKFQEDDETEVALLSITACGTGLNLTRANIAVFAELSWALGSILQAEDRIHRLGQEAATVRALYLVAKDTFDEIMWSSIGKKQNVIGATVGTYKSGSGMNAKAADLDLNRFATISDFAESALKGPSSPSKARVNPYESSSAVKAANPTIDTFFKPLSASPSAAPLPHQISLQCDEVKCENNSSGYEFPYSLPSSDEFRPPQHEEEVLVVHARSNPYEKSVSSAHEKSIPAKPHLALEVPSRPVPAVVVSPASPGEGQSKRPLSPNTKARIERNKQLAMEKRARAQATINAPKEAIATTADGSFNFKSGRGTIVSVSAEAISCASSRLGVPSSVMSSSEGGAALSGFHSAPVPRVRSID